MTLLAFVLDTAVAQPPSTPPVSVAPPFGPSGPSKPPVGSPPPLPATETQPPHWFERTAGPPRPVTEGGVCDWNQPTTLGELYLRADAGFHREIGFPDREALGLEADGRFYVPSAPWFSVVGELREEIVDSGNRLSWTVGGVAERDLYKLAAGIDGIWDTESDTHVGSAFLYMARELPELNSYFGFWATFDLWDDVVTYNHQIGPFTVRQTTVGVKPLEQFNLFYAARLGLDAQWGELYVAPGVEFDQGRFQFSTGYQTTVAPNVDAFVHYYQMASSEDNWSLYAGVQYHIGCGPARPFDFVMPNRIRARQRWGVDSTVLLFN